MRYNDDLRLRDLSIKTALQPLFLYRLSKNLTQETGSYTGLFISNTMTGLTIKSYPSPKWYRHVLHIRCMPSKGHPNWSFKVML